MTCIICVWKNKWTFPAELRRDPKLGQINFRSRLFASYLVKVPLSELCFEAVNLILVPASAHKKLVTGHTCSPSPGLRYNVRWGPLPLSSKNTKNNSPYRVRFPNSGTICRGPPVCLNFRTAYWWDHVLAIYNEECGHLDSPKFWTDDRWPRVL